MEHRMIRDLVIPRGYLYTHRLFHTWIHCLVTQRAHVLRVYC